MIDDFLLSGRAAELIMLVVILEAGVLLWRNRQGRGAPPARWLSPLLAGLLLVLALRLVQGDAPAQWVGLALACAGLAHGWGFRGRWSA